MRQLAKILREITRYFDRNVLAQSSLYRKYEFLPP